MTKDELLSLPPSAAIRALFDCLDETTVQAVYAAPMPKEPLPPKFDSRVYRKEGFTWASECSLRELTFWRNRASSSAASGGQYAEKDAKQAKELGYWIAWREWHPDLTWAGERDRNFVVANPPSGKPYVHPRTSGGQRGGSAPQTQDDDLGTDDSSIPF